MAAWLLGLRDPQLLAVHPMRGALFENMVIAEAFKARTHHGSTDDLYFWRDNNGLEADLLFEVEGRVPTAEIKSGHTVTQDAVRAGTKSVRMVTMTDAVAHPHGWSTGGESYSRSGVEVIGWRDFPARLEGNHVQAEPHCA